MITLDIRNAFNTASWNLITEELKRRRVPAYLENVVENYQDDKEIQVKRKPIRVTT